jgi:MoxR-like ATPase
MSKIASNDQWIELLSNKYGANAVVTRDDIQTVADENTLVFPAWLTSESNRVSRGKYRIPTRVATETVVTPEGKQVTVVSAPANERFVPDAQPGYIKFGNHDKLESIITKRKFYPVYISGLTGCGKTTAALQICHDNDREAFRVNITAETDEDDLLGGFRIVDGQMQFHLGPVTEAMLRGAVLILDEVDLASTKIMCLQPVLEGRSVYLKKIGRTIRPAPGFTVVATANTKGQGAAESGGRYIGTGVLNDAFLDRFPCTLDQDYPTENAESRILRAVFERNGQSGPDIEAFIGHLVAWAAIVRRTYAERAVDECISTRRLVYIAEGYSIFPDRETAVGLVLSRFTGDNKQALLDLYAKVDASIHAAPTAPAATTVTIPEGVVPF